MRAVHQWVHSYVDHDAISSHTRHLQRVIKAMGMESEVYAGESRGPRSKATPIDDYRSLGRPTDTWLLYQMGTESPMAERLAAAEEHVAVSYHNFTPSALIGPWEPAIGAEVDRARAQMVALAPFADAAFGASRFNELELQAAGYANTSTVPILFDPADFEHTLDRKLDTQLQKAKEAGGTDWLFVGRVAPHKAQHDVIKAFAIYQRAYDHKARLHIVGGVSSHLYWTTLKKYIDNLQLGASVTMTAGVSDGALGAYYRNADVFVCLSEHEGFGVPLLEAMHHRIPVVAFDAAAIGETLGSGGLLLSDKSSGVVATAVDRILRDGKLRAAMIKAGDERLGEFTLEKTETKWRRAIEDMVATK